jgi:hypothetical protein
LAPFLDNSSRIFLREFFSPAPALRTEGKKTGPTLFFLAQEFDQSVISCDFMLEHKFVPQSCWCWGMYCRKFPVVADFALEKKTG